MQHNAHYRKRQVRLACNSEPKIHNNAFPSLASSQRLYNVFPLPDSKQHVHRRANARTQPLLIRAGSFGIQSFFPHSPHNSIVAGLTCTVCTVHAHTHTVDIAHSVVGYVSLSFMERIHYIDCRIACRIVERNGVNSNVGHPTTQKKLYAVRLSAV